MKARNFAVVVGALVAASSLVVPSASAAPPKVKPDMKKAAEIFAQRCASCHGATGVGDGPAAAALQPKPRNFKDPAWQKSVTDAHIEKVIAEGGPAVGKSPMMPPNPDLANDKAVLAGLRQYIRNLAKKK
jgi:mono/diheme cytochrome c family protein